MIVSSSAEAQNATSAADIASLDDFDEAGVTFALVATVFFTGVTLITFAAAYDAVGAPTRPITTIPATSASKAMYPNLFFILFPLFADSSGKSGSI